MNLFKTTQDHIKYWENRKIDWKKSYGDNWDHPHRYLISALLTTFPWVSLLEIGCGAGANMINILKHFKDRQLAGIDVSKDAIETAQTSFKGALLKVGSGEDIMLSDDSTDVVLTDMCLIYVGSGKIDKYIKEIKRVARNRVVFCEFHSESLYARIKLKYNSGYNCYNYRKLLEKHGFYDISLYKVPEEAWPGGDPQKTFAYLIVAKVPKRK